MAPTHLLLEIEKPRESARPAARPCSRRTAIRSGTASWLWMHNGVIRDFDACKRDLRVAVDPVAVRGDRGLDGLRDVLLSRADDRARGRSAEGGPGCRRPDRGDRATARRRASDADDRRDDERREHLGVPLLERGPVAFALLQHRHRRRCGCCTRTMLACKTSTTSRGWSSRSRSAIWPAPGTRCPSRAGASSSRARTRCTTVHADPRAGLAGRIRRRRLLRVQWWKLVAVPSCIGGGCFCSRGSCRLRSAMSRSAMS